MSDVDEIPMFGKFVAQVEKTCSDQICQNLRTQLS